MATMNDDDKVPLAHADLLEEIVRSLVADQSSVTIVEQLDEAQNVLRLSVGVAPTDRGKVIGKRGGTIGLLRRLFTCVGAADNHLRILVDVDQGPDGGRPTFRTRPTTEA